MVSLLEREDELERLAWAVEQAVSGRGGVALVGGEAGIGKTSLVRALHERVEEQVTWLVGACESLSVPIPLGPLRELFEAAGGGDLVALGSDDRLVLGRAVLAALAECAPAVAVIEDVHWADPLTVDLVRILARRVEEIGVLVVVTYRDDEVGAHPALRLLLGDLATNPVLTRILLRPLSASAVRDLAGPSGLDAGELVRATGGNPFLVVESIAAGGRLPASVRDAALARVGRLSLAAREAVDAAAVIGQRFDAALLRSVLPVDLEVLEEAQARGVLLADGSLLGFRHELIRDAIESSISAQRRRELHARVMATLAEQTDTADHARLAHHAELAGRTADASRYAMLAAAEAEQVGALRETCLQADRALRLADGLDASERFELLVQYSRASNFSNPRVEDAVAAAEQAVALAEELDDPVRRARALMSLAWALWSPERVVEARAAAEQAIAALEGAGDIGALARAHSTLVRLEATAFDPAVAVESGSRALSLAQEAGLEEVKIDVCISVGLAHGHLGRPDAPRILEDALDAAKRSRLTLQTVRTYVNLMFVAVALRDHARADRILGEALPLLEEFHTPIPALAIETFHARSLLDRGRWAEAQATAVRRDRSLQGEVAVMRALDGLIRARRGEPDATRLLEHAWDEILELVPAESSRHGMIRLALVEAAWLRDDRGQALAQLRAARESPAVSRFARSGGELAVWGARFGMELEVPSGAPAPVLQELAGDWKHAIAAWRQFDAPYEAALAALGGDERDARQALAILHGLGGAAAAKAFSRERAARGARPARGPRRSTIANPAGLTRREQEVLEQLATGATNATIAGAFHLSERTVGHHVAAILSKLGAPNRLAAVEQARARGLLAQDRQPASPR